MVGVGAVLCLFVLIFAPVFDLSSFPSFTIPVLLSLFPVVAIRWNKDDPPKGPCDSELSRMDGKVSSPS